MTRLAFLGSLGSAGLLGCTISNPAFEATSDGVGSDGSGQASGSTTSGDPTAEGSEGDVPPSTSGSSDLDDTSAGSCQDECDAHAECVNALCECVDGWAGDGLSCARLVPELLRVELGCQNDDSCEVGCSVDENDSAQGKLEGNPDRTYAVTLRIRGVLELKTYLGGDTEPPVNLGGEPADDPWNVYSLEVSDPPAVLHLNAGLSGSMFCVPIDETFTLEVRGEASLVLEAWSGGDACGIPNVDLRGQPIAFEGMAPFDGQFVEIDVIGIQPKTDG